MSMWSKAVKAVDSIKTATTQLVKEKEKKIEPEAKEDEIVYDPIRKRYVINGAIPED